MTDLVKIKAEDYGLTTETAANIAAQFQPMLNLMVELEHEFNEVAQLPLGEPTTEAKAKALLQKYVKVRTGTADIHKNQKQFYLLAGRYVDGWKNAQMMASNGKEQALKEIVDYRAIQEAKRIAELQAERLEAIREYYPDAGNADLGRMPADVWEAYYSAKKQAHIDRIEAERKAEEERIERERAEAAERERIRLENERLKAEAAEAEARRIAEQKAAQVRLEKERREAVAKLKSEREAREKAEAEARAQADAERKERERLEAELKAQREKAEAEARAKAEAVERERIEREKAAKAPIIEQINNWVDSFQLPVAPVKNEISDMILEKFESFKVWAKNQLTK